MIVEEFTRVKCPAGAEPGRTTAVVMLINQAARRQEFYMLTCSGLVPDKSHPKFIRTRAAGDVIRFTPHP